MFLKIARKNKRVHHDDKLEVNSFRSRSLFFLALRISCPFFYLILLRTVPFRFRFVLVSFVFDLEREKVGLERERKRKKAETQCRRESVKGRKLFLLLLSLARPPPPSCAALPPLLSPPARALRFVAIAIVFSFLLLLFPFLSLSLLSLSFRSKFFAPDFALEISKEISTQICLTKDKAGLCWASQGQSFDQLLNNFDRLKPKVLKLGRTSGANGLIGDSLFYSSSAFVFVLFFLLFWKGLGSCAAKRPSQNQERKIQLKERESYVSVVYGEAKAAQDYSKVVVSPLGQCLVGKVLDQDQKDQVAGSSCW